MAEVSYYSYEYDPDSEPFLADADAGDHLVFADRRGDVEQKLLLPADVQPPTLDTKTTPERWYDSPTETHRPRCHLASLYFS